MADLISRAKTLKDHNARQVVFAGDCATKAMDALKAYADKHKVRLDQFMKTGNNPLTGQEVKLVRTIPRLVIVNDLLTIWLDQWNDILHALYEQGIGITGAPYAAD